MLEFIFFFIVILGLGWLLWFFFVGKTVKIAAEGDEARGQNNPDAPGRRERPGLLLGETVDPSGTDPDVVAGATGYGPKRLHAVEPGLTRAVCGAEVVPVEGVREGEATWPPALGSACEACQQVLADEEGAAVNREGGTHPPAPTPGEARDEPGWRQAGDEGPARGGPAR
jgi:hypothetical protein